MRVTIRNRTDGGSTGANGGNGANGAKGSSARRAKTVRRVPRSVILFRRFRGSVAEIAEAILQISSGAKPYVPRVQVRETSEAIIVAVTLRGFDVASLDVSLAGQFVSVRGTKTEVMEQTRRKYRMVQQVYRTFDRTIPLHGDFDRRAAVATLLKGVLRVRVPRIESERSSAKPEYATAAPPQASQLSP